MFAGIDNKARKVTGAHIGVDGVARRVKKAYVGVDGVARLAWEAGGESGRVRAYLYNGVKLPEPPKWDAAAAPEAVIVKSNKSTTSDTYFYCGKDMLSVGKINTTILSRPYAGYILTDSGWSRTDYWLGITTTSNVLWANYDVYYKDSEDVGELAGTLFLAASEPVPLCSYNGMELPKLPEWDTTEYPYACIARSALGLYTFGASKSPVLVRDDNKGRPRCDWDPPYLRSTKWAATDQWPELQYTETLSGSDLSSDISMWANYDIEYNGEVIVTASDPVPVYL